MVHKPMRELDLLGYRFSGQIARAALVALFGFVAIMLAAPVLLLRYQYFQ
jgi:hypothetical protein